MIELIKIHDDARGEIYLLQGDFVEHEEITVFITRETFARGGCIHKINDEFCVVLEGKIKYFIGDNEPKIFQKGQSVTIPSNTPHYFLSLTDSLVLEWGATPQEKKEKHELFRKKVEEINKKRVLINEKN